MGAIYILSILLLIKMKFSLNMEELEFRKRLLII
jgi:hypothetical protein